MLRDRVRVARTKAGTRRSPPAPGRSCAGQASTPGSPEAGGVASGHPWLVQLEGPHPVVARCTRRAACARRPEPNPKEQWNERIDETQAMDRCSCGRSGRRSGNCCGGAGSELRPLEHPDQRRIRPGTSTELNTSFQDGCPILSPDGLSLYMASNRPGGMGGIDIWVASRASTNSPFSAPVNPGAPVNSTADDFCPSPMAGGWFFFVSTRAPAAGTRTSTSPGRWVAAGGSRCTWDARSTAPDRRRARTCSR